MNALQLLTFRAITAYLLIIRCRSVVICTSGDCDINCDSHNCNTIICTNKASSCTVTCQDGQCQQSKLYLAAYNYNIVSCAGNHSCDEINIICGSSDDPPKGYTKQDFIGHINECNLILQSNAMPTAACLHCHIDIDICQCVGDGCDRINKSMDTESSINNEFLSQTPSNKINSDFIYILLFVIMGMLCMGFGICCCIHIFYESKREIFQMQFDAVDIGPQESISSETESEQNLFHVSRETIS
eukprot:UN08498